MTFIIATLIKKMSSRYKVMCGCKCCIYSKSIHLSLLSWRDWYFKKTGIKDKMLKTEGLGEKQVHIYEAYKNTVMPHGRHIYAKAYDVAKAKMCAYTQSYHALPHRKCVLGCCAKRPSVNLPDQETDAHYPDTSPSISFHIDYLIAYCITHVRLPLTEKIVFSSVKMILLQKNQQKYTLEKI